MARKTPKTKTITSRSLTLSTNSFSLDFTWRKVEIEENASPLREPGRSEPLVKRENFAQVLQRKQIANLVAPINEDISPYRTLPISLGPVSPVLKRQMVRKYGIIEELPLDSDKDEYV